jgi:hypothetical protein
MGWNGSLSLNSFPAGRMLAAEGVGHKETIPQDDAILFGSRPGETMIFDPDEVQSALRKAWSLSTARQWTPENPAAGQCNVTALLIHELFGGDILKTSLPAGDHFYNQVGGRRYDFTASQFDQPIAYMDLPASRTDAERGATDDELAQLRAAFSGARCQVGLGSFSTDSAGCRFG